MIESPEGKYHFTVSKLTINAYYLLKVCITLMVVVFLSICLIH